LRGLHLPLSTGFGDAALLIEELTKDILVKVLKHRGLLRLVRHLLQVFAEGRVLRV
jgi:hypothetical protein